MRIDLVLGWGVLIFYQGLKIVSLIIKGYGRSFKVMEGHGRSEKVMEKRNFFFKMKHFFLDTLNCEVVAEDSSGTKQFCTNQ